ncbi:Gfo/Idh/MocA family oxidoreductase [Cohnella ginsengisoli]|uniref:Gfo/Idh/MocA family oxidoreductase n=1 Tax=Cohnella ginsengisoli TaxID=425004 RepID=A0A9X4KLK2_9BACL|nr:Gfo/Idh/MocA family oxidoreductase [Cohnella ginsengisoli]MDG0794140.1 Gfo/Idh/MocA family oxidoreductase [Cohnella ginsengisoli]
MVYRVAVVGGGAIAESHLEAIARMEQVQSAAVADLVGERAEALAGKYGAAPYTDYREMIVRERPDIAIVTLPHYLHKEAAMFCLAQGCHVLLEKPMALDVEECDEIVEAARRSGSALLVGHTQHYIPENRAAKRIIEEGSLGRLVMVNDVRNVYYFREDRPSWFFKQSLAGGGILMNLGSHSIDKITWLAGSEVDKVSASVSGQGRRAISREAAWRFCACEAACRLRSRCRATRDMRGTRPSSSSRMACCGSRRAKRSGSAAAGTTSGWRRRRRSRLSSCSSRT